MAQQIQKPQSPPLPVWVIAVCVVGLIMAVIIGFFGYQWFKSSGLGVILTAEQKQFPDYQISENEETVSGSSSGPLYTITMTSSAMPSEAQMAVAGSVACANGLKNGAQVTVVGQKQYFWLPIYTYASAPGVCANGGWTRDSNQ